MSIREIDFHSVSGLNEFIKIYTHDDMGPGGAYHNYTIELDREIVTPIGFQKGGVVEAGRNGLTNEALLAVVLDRLNCFQAGPFACDTNEEAREHVRAALTALQSRTRDRIARGVEGVSVA